jgi:NTE family protein
MPPSLPSRKPSLAERTGHANPQKLGLVFSSGFFGFFAHAGCLSALRELGYEPCAYAGASSGAIIAAMAACDMKDQEILDMLLALRRSQFWDPDPWPTIVAKALGLFRGYGGYLRGEGFGRLLQRIPKRRIEECRSRLMIVATNLTKRREEIFTEGDLIAAVRASGAVPVLFQPVKIAGCSYVDGGVVNKAPVKAMADRCEVDRIVVHYVASENLEGEGTDGFFERRFSPLHIQYLSVNIARQEAYRNQIEMVRSRGIEVIEVKTESPPVGPGRLDLGPAAYEAARQMTLASLPPLGTGRP